LQPCRMPMPQRCRQRILRHRRTATAPVICYTLPLLTPRRRHYLHTTCHACAAACRQRSGYVSRYEYAFHAFATPYALSPSHASRRQPRPAQRGNVFHNAPLAELRRCRRPAAAAYTPPPRLPFADTLRARYRHARPAPDAAAATAAAESTGRGRRWKKALQAAAAHVEEHALHQHEAVMTPSRAANAVEGSPAGGGTRFCWRSPVAAESR